MCIDPQRDSECSYIEHGKVPNPATGSLLPSPTSFTYTSVRGINHVYSFGSGHGLELVVDKIG